MVVDNPAIEVIRMLLNLVPYGLLFPFNYCFITKTVNISINDTKTAAFDNNILIF